MLEGFVVFPIRQSSSIVGKGVSSCLFSTGSLAVAFLDVAVLADLERMWLGDGLGSFLEGSSFFQWRPFQLMSNSISSLGGYA